MTAAVPDQAAARRVLAATCVSYMLVLLDASIANVALTDIAHTFGSRVAGLQWIVNAYTLAFASLLLTGGTLGDRLGDRTVYVAGLAVFVAASALCGVAPTLPALAVARALQGVGSAMLVPCSLALINRAFPEPAARASAISVWMGCGGIAMASGPLIGGLLIDLSGWRSLFFVNLPLGLAGIGLGRTVAPDAVDRSRQFDWGGQAAAIVAIGALIGTLIEGPSLGWHSAPIVGGAMASVVAFIAIEARRREPMLPLAFFRNRLFAGSTFVSMASAFVFYGLLFVLSLFYRQVRGASPLDTGLAFLPMTAMVALGGLTSGRIVARFGARGTMCTAFGLYAAGAIGMTAIGATTPAWLAVAPMLAIGFASGFISPAATAPALGTIDRQRAGVAAAVLNAARQSGSALGVAIFGACIATLQPFPVAMRGVLALAAGLSALAAATWWLTVQAAPATAATTAPLRAAARR
ncbi:MFS transporter [Burkholderia cenocepacia]|uniref:MFS transporter n=1 Tax=Burkholderia cepacia complex TaxID=87882 RepID=UPI001BA2FFFA|nr:MULTISPECIES: MFS transporter [Burkholderia cepacia complex]ELW9445587.1 MFS transporter [Burkholderia cenocepacia]MBR8483618.1 MFS transporter [Burkholderia cenocepacia]MDN7468837.1 MFS transporter [Burkholderia orbicola]MDN7507009.1 MFS transporter [Burkholderia orbicola]